MSRRPKGEKIDGWVILDKPPGLGSTDAVARVKRLFNAQKAGHAGTLDPLATGILAIALGEATKTVPFAFDARKTYRFTVRWGIETDTLDADGKVTGESPVRPPAEAILAALPQFTGTIMQVPPAFSAIKVNGERAYDLAREGETVELAARPAEIFRLELIATPSPDEARLEMVTGKGVYVRSLARDLARALGTLGHVIELRRTRVGAFGLAQAISLEALGETGYSPPASRHLHPVETALDDIPALAIGEADAARIRSGQAVPVRGKAFAIIEALMDGQGDEAPLILLKEISGRALAIAEIRLGAFHPSRVFNL
jgi:tRNA pseudouridine55 synthase